MKQLKELYNLIFDDGEDAWTRACNDFREWLTLQDTKFADEYYKKSYEIEISSLKNRFEALVFQDSDYYLGSRKYRYRVNLQRIKDLEEIKRKITQLDYYKYLKSTDYTYYGYGRRY